MGCIAAKAGWAGMADGGGMAIINSWPSGPQKTCKGGGAGEAAAATEPPAMV